MAKRWLDFDRAMLLLFALSIFIVAKAAIIPQQDEAETAMEKLASADGIGILDSNGIVDEKVKLLEEMDYAAVKESLGIKKDFCLYFEDDSGNMVRVDHASSGIGHEKIHVSGEPCS